MPTTSNFGWTTPADTDLVKDGALAIRTLGNGIDTSMAQLKGGTTGQVLSKTSNTDMAFTWVTQDDANAIQNAIVDAKGDLIAATANDTPARLAVGNNGETLVADSSTSTGLRYQTGVNNNAIINGGFDFWQRGTSISAGTSALNYSADRWAAVRGANASAFTVSRQNTSDTTNLPFIQYCARVARTASNSTTDTIFLATSLESASSIPFAGRTIIFSFYARAGANFSAASSNLSFQVVSGTGTDQNVYTGFTGAAAVINTTATLTTTWQRFTATATVSASATQLGAYFYYAPVGTAGANDWFEVTGVQLELGSVATTFKRSGGTLAGEFQAASRYYQRFTNTSSNALYAHSGINTTSTRSFHYVALQTAMRTSPSVAEVGAQVGDTVGSNLDITAISVYTVANNSISLDCTHASGYSASAPLFLVLPQNAYIELSAEL